MLDSTKAEQKCVGYGKLQELQDYNIRNYDRRQLLHIQTTQVDKVVQQRFR